VAALVLLINVELSLPCVRRSGLVSLLMMRFTRPRRYFLSDEFGTKAIPSVQRVVSVAEQPQIVGRGVAARRPGTHVIVFEKSLRLAAPPVRRYERTPPLIAGENLTPHCGGHVTSSPIDAKRAPVSLRPAAASLKPSACTQYANADG